MRLWLAGAALLAAVACGATDSEAGPTAGAANARPALAVLSTDPFRVGGTGFRPREQVRVTLAVDGRTTTVSRRAGERGRFWVTLAEDACTATVQAVGARGSRASASLAHVTCPVTR